MRWNLQFNIFGQSFSQSVEKPQRRPSLCSLRMRAHCLPLWTAWESSSMCGLPFFRTRKDAQQQWGGFGNKRGSYFIFLLCHNNCGKLKLQLMEEILDIFVSLSVVVLWFVHFKSEPQTALGSLLSLWRFDRTVHSKERRSNPHGPRSQLIYPLRYLAFVIECSLRTQCTR